MHRRQLLLDTEPGVLGIQGKMTQRKRVKKGGTYFLYQLYKLSNYHCL